MEFSEAKTPVTATMTIIGSSMTAGTFKSWAKTRLAMMPPVGISSKAVMSIAQA